MLRKLPECVAWIISASHSCTGMVFSIYFHISLCPSSLPEPVCECERKYQFNPAACACLYTNGIDGNAGLCLLTIFQACAIIRSRLESLRLNGICYFFCFRFARANASLLLCVCEDETYNNNKCTLNMDDYCRTLKCGNYAQQIGRFGCSVCLCVCVVAFSAENWKWIGIDGRWFPETLAQLARVLWAYKYCYCYGNVLWK